MLSELEFDLVIGFFFQSLNLRLVNLKHADKAV